MTSDNTLVERLEQTIADLAKQVGEAAAELTRLQSLASAAELVAWRDPANAPRDGTMLRLLVQRGDVDRGAWAPFADSLDPYTTIGFNNLANTQEDEWEFAGWDWSHDCFTTGYGEVVGWLPFEATPPASASAGEVAEAIRQIDGFIHVSEQVSGHVNGISGRNLRDWRSALTAPPATPAVEITEDTQHG